MGRDGTFQVLDELLDRVERGESEVVVVEGEAGIGKSAVLERCAADARDRGFLVLSGRGEELGATRPFAPLLDALAQQPGGEDARRAHHLLVEEHTSQIAVLEIAPGIQSLLVDDLVDRIEDLCVGQPLALCVDDLHWADASTLASLVSLVRRGADLPLLLAVALRPVPRSTEVTAFFDALDPGPAAGHTTRIELARLTDDDVRGLSTELLRSPPGPGVLRLLDGCAGNPLLIVEMLASLLDAGLLIEQGGQVETSGDPAELRLPASLTETVRNRVARLDGELKAVATVAALLRSRFTLGDLAAVTGRAPTDLLPLVETLVDARLFADDGSSLAYRHDLVRDAVVSALPESVRAELHRQIADALQAAGASIVRVAEQLALGAPQGSVEAVAVLRAAAEEIVQQDPAGAESLLRRALELCAPTDPQRDLLWAALVDSLTWSGHRDEAETIATDVLSRPVAVEVEIALRSALSRVLLLAGRSLEAITHEERLMELHASEGHSNAWALAECSVCRAFAFQFEAALADATEAVALGEADGDPMPTIVGLNVQSFVHSARGDTASASELASLAAHTADETPSGRGHRLHPNLYRALALQTGGNHEDAMRAVERGRTLGEALGAAWALPLYHFLTALTHWDRGHWDDLLTEVDAGAAYGTDRAPSLGQGFGYALAARVHLHRGDLEQAATLLDEGGRVVIEGAGGFGGDWITLVRGLLLEAEDRPDDALDLLRLLWGTALALGTLATVTVVSGDLVRLTMAAGADDEASKVADEVTHLAERFPDNALLVARERRVRGLVEADGGALQQAVAAFDVLGHLFEAATARAEAADRALVDDRTEVAVELLERSLAAHDDLGAVRHAEGVRERLTGLSRSTRRRAPRAVTGWGALTPTEWEIAEEVCGGRSNGQVAERLGISRRTVEAHLRSIYPKLGVSTRLALSVAYQERDQGT